MAHAPCPLTTRQAQALELAAFLGATASCTPRPVFTVAALRRHLGQEAPRPSPAVLEDLLWQLFARGFVGITSRGACYGLSNVLRLTEHLGLTQAEEDAYFQWLDAYEPA